MLLTARLNSAQPIAGMMYELDAIAATVIGGTSLLGGEGTVVGTLIGALIMAVLRNGLNLLGVSSFFQQVVIGSVIIAAVLIDMWLKRRAAVSWQSESDPRRSHAMSSLVRGSWLAADPADRRCRGCQRGAEHRRGGAGRQRIALVMKTAEQPLLHRDAEGRRGGREAA